MKFNDIVNNLTSGEWSPKMRARTDVQQYKNACESLINMIPLVQGGVSRRPGTKSLVFSDAAAVTRLQAMLVDNGVYPKMIPIELSDGTSRILVVAGGSTPSTAWFVISGTTLTSATFSYVDTNIDVSTALALNHTQVGDLVILTDPKGLTRPRVWSPNTTTAGEYWAIRAHAALYATGFVPGTDTPYLPLNALGSSVNMTSSAATGNVTITSSASFFTSVFVEGMYLKLGSAGSTGVVRITARLTDTTASAVVLHTVPTVTVGTAAGTSWEESAWSDKRGYPKYCVPHEGRLYYGGHPAYPDTIWGSRIGNVFDMMERLFEQDPDYATNNADNSRPFSVTPNTQGGGSIVGLSAGKALHIHTATSVITAAGLQGAFGPLDSGLESNTSFGSAAIPSARTGAYLAYVENGGRKIRDLSFNFDESQYKTADLTFMADHLTTVSLALAQAAGTDTDTIAQIVPAKICGISGLLCRTILGRLLWVSLDREYQVNGWAQISLGGALGNFHPEVNAICALAGRIFLIVNRTINGNEVVQIEYFTYHAETSYLSDTVGRHMDSMKSFSSGSPTVTVTGATHLAGQTVQVIADGQYVGEKTVSVGGVITLSVPAYTVIYGLRCDASITTFPPELGQQVPGTSQGLIKRISEVTIRFLNTYGAKYGQTTTALLDIDFKDPTAPMDNSPALFTGMKKMSFPGDYVTDKGIILKSDIPFPFYVLAIIAKGATYD